MPVSARGCIIRVVVAGTAKPPPAELKGKSVSLTEFKQAIANKKLLCPECKKPIEEYERFQEVEDVQDGAGDSRVDSSGNYKVTLKCTTAPCAWKERTEYWRNLIED